MTNLLYSAKHYQIKTAKDATRAEEAADRAENYADSLHPETFVKTSGDQTIDGIKTLTHTMKQKNPNITSSIAPSANQFVQHWAVDQNGVLLGCFEYRQLTDGSSGTSIVLRKKGTESSPVWERIGIFQDTNGNFYTYAPTPAATDNSTKMATTAWVNNRMGSHGLFCTTTVSGTSWSREWKNLSGTRVWLEQGGRVGQRSGNGEVTVTLPKAFSNTNYTVVQSNISTYNENESGVIRNITSTSFGIYAWNGRSSIWYACGK